MWRHRISISASLALTVAVSFGATWHVPADVATIQAALDSTNDGDTVLVAANSYHEALQAPNHRFVLLGVVVPPDSQRPVIDPTPLEGSNHLACLTLTSLSRAVIRDFVFRNGRGMFPREHPEDVGGIANNASSLIIERCLFDSTYKGLECDLTCVGPVTISDCQFVLNTGGCVRDRSPARTTVFNCDFSWNGDRALWLVDSALVAECHFRDIHSEGFEPIWLEGYGITIRGCTFGPTATSVNDIFWTNNMWAFTFEQNTVADADVWNSVIEFHGLDVGSDTTYVRNNIFRQNRAVQALGGGGGIRLNWLVEDLANPPIVVADNIFDSCLAISRTYGFGSVYMGPFNHRLEHNLFVTSSGTGPAVRKGQVDTTVIGNSSIHNCSFNHTDIALAADRWYFNAESNWWSDPSGPYHETINPAGLGDTILGRQVEFTPWLTEDPLIESTPTPNAPVPNSARLDVYPNPFNATATLSFFVETPGMYAIELYNTLGQRVEELWSGLVVGEQSITVHADNLSSGIYFACARQRENRHVVAIVKVALLK